MIKKILIGCFTAFIIAFQVYAINYFDILNQTLDTVNRASQYIPKNDDYGSSRQTPDYPSKQDRYQPREDNYPTYGQNNSPSTMPTKQQETTIPQGRRWDQRNTNTAQQVATTLAEVPAGTIVMDPNSIWNYRDGINYSGDTKVKLPVFWVKLEDNHYTQGSTLLLSQLEVAEYKFCHTQKGLRAWNESDVRRFLRTTFYSHLSPGFQNSIVNVNIPYADLTGKPATVLDNLFLLSIVEWGASDRANNGKGIKYNDMPALYVSKYIRYIEPWENYEIRNHDSTTTLTRTINRPKASSAGYKDDVFVIRHDGTLRTEYYDSVVQLVRPAVNLKSTTKVKGPYQFNYDIRGREHFIYYELDFSAQ